MEMNDVDPALPRPARQAVDDDVRTKRMTAPNALASSSRLFHSFWLGGLKAAQHVNGRGARVDMIAATRHDRQAAQDYARLRSVGIRAVREGVRWHLVDRGDGYDFSSLAAIAHAARAGGMQVVWTLCHYGWPDGLDIFSRAFIDRFSQYCEAAARFLAGCGEGVPFNSPINEISFFACGKAGWFHPYARGRGDELKRQLVRAAIAGAEAIWAVDPRARIVHVDPIIHVVAPHNRLELSARAAAATERQFEAWDMLVGWSHPELGGHPRYLDIVGANFYYDGQWEQEGERLRWEDAPRDDRWAPLSQLLAAVHITAPIRGKSAMRCGTGSNR